MHSIFQQDPGVDVRQAPEDAQSSNGSSPAGFLKPRKGMATYTLVDVDTAEIPDLPWDGFDGGNFVSELVQFCLAALGLAITAPLFLLLALLIKLGSPGPVFYRGLRVGKGRRIFKIFKFRTLKPGAEQEIGARLLNPEDHYYTPLGRFLKKTKLDELPQLLNVLKREMNLVGPRPIRPIFLPQLSRTVPHYLTRFIVRPGMTGLAQLKGGYFTAPRDKLRYELIYICNRTLFFDIKLILMTFFKLLNRWFTLGFFSLILFAFVSFGPENLLPSLYTYALGFRLNLVHIAIIIGGGWFLAKRIPHGRLYLYRSPINTAMLVFLLFTLATSYMAMQPFTSFRGSIYYGVTGFLISLLLMNGETSDRFIKNTVRIVALLAVVVSLVGLFQLVLLTQFSAAQAAPLSNPHAGAFPRISSTLGNPVVLSTYLVLGFPLLLCEVAHADRKSQRDFWVICTTIAFIGILLTQTRAGLVALAVTGAIFLSKRSKPLFGAFLLGFTGLFLLLSFLAGPRYAPATVIRELTQSWSHTVTRLSQLPAKRLIIGIGTKNLPSFTSPAPTLPADDQRLERFIPSSMHLTLLIENGILGWLMMMWILFVILKSLYVAHARIKDPFLQMILWSIFSSIVGFIVSMTTFKAFFNLSIQILFWSLVGIGMLIATRFTEKKNGFIRLWRFGD